MIHDIVNNFRAVVIVRGSLNAQVEDNEDVCMGQE